MGVGGWGVGGERHERREWATLPVATPLARTLFSARASSAPANRSRSSASARKSARCGAQDARKQVGQRSARLCPLLHRLQAPMVP